jgi:hypothetical protein
MGELIRSLIELPVARFTAVVADSYRIGSPMRLFFEKLLNAAIRLRLRVDVIPFLKQLISFGPTKVRNSVDALLQARAQPNQ